MRSTVKVFLLVGLVVALAPSLLQAQPVQLECETGEWGAQVRQRPAPFRAIGASQRLLSGRSPNFNNSQWSFPDLAIGYTEAYLGMFESESALRVYHELVIATVNEGFQEDQVPVRVRLKWQGLVNYHGSGDLIQDYRTMEEQDAAGNCTLPFGCLRRQLGVDGILLGVGYGGGVAWGPFGVLGGPGLSTAVHELGHMFLLKHALRYLTGESCSPGDLLCQLAHAYEGTTQAGDEYSTMTGYGPDLLPRGGGPNLMHEGSPTGKQNESEGARVVAAVGPDFEQETPPTVSGPCTPNAHTLCLNQGRFGVQAFWQTSGGQVGQGGATPLTPDSGYFWFFNPNNLEVVVKVLNACASQDPRYWVFAFGGTNVDVELVVTDHQTGREWRHNNPQGVNFEPRFDTAAFDTCP